MQAKKPQPELLNKGEAISQLLLFLRLDHIKAGQDIMKILGKNSLREKEYWTKLLDSKTDTFSGYSRHYNPCNVIIFREAFFIAALEALRKEIEQNRIIAGKKGLGILLEELKKELISIKAYMFDEEAVINNLNVETEKKSKESSTSELWKKYADVFNLPDGIADTFVTVNDIDIQYLKPYLEFVELQYLKLMQLSYDELNKEEGQRAVVNRGAYTDERTLPEMFKVKDLLISLCEALAKDRIAYVEKINDREYRWIKKTTELAAFGFWLSNHKDKLFRDKKDFDDGNHRGRTLRNFFDRSIKTDEENKDSYQQFQDGKKADKLVDKFNFLNTLIQ